VERQLEEGLHRIQLTASSLMHEIASEVWRSAGGDKDDVRARILHELSRDQALRSLISHSDERFQALSVRTARLEDTLTHVADSVRAGREELAEGVRAIATGEGADHDQELRTQLASVMRQIAGALATLAERDQAIVDAVRDRVHEHGQLVARETARISEAMESYVQHGVEAVGQLAGRVDAQLLALTEREDAVGARIDRTVEEQMRLLGEQLQLVHERVAIEATGITEAIAHGPSKTDERLQAVDEYLHLLSERIDVASRESLAEMRRTLEARVMGLAQLVRSDSQALRDELVATAGQIDEHAARMLDDRLAVVSDALTQGTSRMIEEHGRRMQEETAHALRAWVDDAVARVESRLDEQGRQLESRVDEQGRQLDGRAEEAISAIDRNLVRMTDAIESQFERLGRNVGERAAHAADVAIGERFDHVLARLHEAAGTVERLETTVQEGRAAVGHLETAIGDGQTAMEESVDRRMAGLARLIRSDNETLAQQIVADQDASKQSLRAMKELQANLPAEIIEMVEQRFASLAESIERSNELLAKRLDRMAETIGERYDNDIQVVIDRMGDAMHALASVGRPGSTDAPAE
jgi:hypothetical protein